MALLDGNGNGLKRNDSEGLSGAINQMSGPGDQVQGPNGSEYSHAATGAGNLAGGYRGLAPQQQGRQGAQINTGYQAPNQQRMDAARGDLGAAYQYARDVYNGTGPSTAYSQFQSMNDAAIRNQMAMANSAHGSTAQAGAMREAQLQGGQLGAQAAATGAGIRASEQLGALAQMNNVANNEGQLSLGQYQVEQQPALEQARLNQQQQGLNDAYSQYLYGLSEQEQRDQLAAMQGYDKSSLGAQELQHNANKDANSGGMGLLGGIASGLGGLLMSDETAKEDFSYAGLNDGRQMAGLSEYANSDTRRRQLGDVVSDEDQKSGLSHRTAEADSFLDTLKPYSYRYKDASDEPSSSPSGGRYLGVIAQNVEKGPTGKTIVKDTPRGKKLEGGALMSALAAGEGRLHERVSQLEAALAAKRGNRG